MGIVSKEKVKRVNVVGELSSEKVECQRNRPNVNGRHLENTAEGEVRKRSGTCGVWSVNRSKGISFIRPWTLCGKIASGGGRGGGIKVKYWAKPNLCNLWRYRRDLYPLALLRSLTCIIVLIVHSSNMPSNN